MSPLVLLAASLSFAQTRYDYAYPDVVDGFGASVATGDVNGDGYDDIFVGAPGDPNEPGRVMMFAGGPAGPSLVSSWRSSLRRQDDAHFGQALASADVNGDGYDDLIVGASWADGAFTNEGRVFVFHGSAAGLDSKGLPSTVLLSTEGAASYFGEHLAAADIDGDGFADILVGALYGAGGNGSLAVFPGSAVGAATVASQVIPGTGLWDSFGTVAAVGDLQGDGYEDVLVGAISHDGVVSNGGEATLFYGSAGGLVASGWSVEGQVQEAYMGSHACGPGDVDGDGYDDLVVSAFYTSAGYTHEGATYLYRGGPLGIDLFPTSTILGDQTVAYLGAVAPAGDVNGDGYADLLVGAPGLDVVSYDDGSLFVHLGSPSGLDPLPFEVYDGLTLGAGLGRAVAPASDFNGDGALDFVATGGSTFTAVVR